MLSLCSAAADAAQRKILIASFDDIVIDGDMQVTLETGKSPTALATGDRDEIDRVRIDRLGSTLRIQMIQTTTNDRSRAPTEPLRITLTNRHVRNIVLRGNARLDINTVKESGPAKLTLSGSGEIKIGSLTADRFDATLVGNGRVTIGSGAVRISEVAIQGGAIFDAAGLTSRRLTLTHNGNANTTTAVQESAEITNSGSGSIKIGGVGSCFVRIPGQATITCTKREDKKN